MNNFFEDLKKARLFGHPIHLMLVHFPSALFPVSVIFDVLAFILGDTSLAIVAFYTLAAGLIGGICAAFFGAIDFFRLPSTHPAWKKAGLHAGLNLLWLCLFTVLFGLRMSMFPNIELASATELVLTILGVIGLIFSNYLGGDLVLRHKVGLTDEEEKWNR